MSDHPVALLNLKDEAEPDGASNGGWWIASLVSLFGLIALGILIALSLPRNESDWFGMRYIATFGLAGLVGSILCVAFAVVSLVKKERRLPWAALPAVLCLGFLVSTLGSLLQPQITAYYAALEREDSAAARARLAADPEIVLRERWDKSESVYERAAFRLSFKNPGVQYTMNQLQRIYDQAPDMRGDVFAHPACTPEFLTTHFHEAWDLGGRSTMLSNIIAHPNTPIELVEKVANSTAKGNDAQYNVAAAKRALKARQQGQEPVRP